MELVVQEVEGLAVRVAELEVELVEGLEVRGVALVVELEEEREELAVLALAYENPLHLLRMYLVRHTHVLQHLYPSPQHQTLFCRIYHVRLDAKQ